MAGSASMAENVGGSDPRGTGMEGAAGIAPGIASARRLIPQPPGGRVNLNAGTAFPTPYPVQQRAAELREMLTASPSDFYWRQSPPLIAAAREELAGYLGTRADQLVLVPNTTFAINLVVASLSYLRGTEVLLTDHDYGAMTYVWQRWSDVRDWAPKRVELPFGPDAETGQILETFERAITPATRVLFLYHCTAPTGLVLPVAEICAMARERDIVTVVDGAHAPGAVPVNLSEIGADFYAANLHKWMMCPVASGFLYVARHRRTDLRPLVTSWGWGYSRSEAFEDSGQGGQRWQWDLEFHGTADRIGQMCVPAALAFRRGLGSEAELAAHRARLFDHARAVMPLACASPRCAELGGPLMVFELPGGGGGADLIGDRDRLYNEFGVEVNLTEAAGRKYCRISAGVFNTTEDIDRLAKAARAVWCG